MAEGVWERGKLKAVWQPLGRNANGETRYRRAGWDVLLWQKPGGTDRELFIVPLGFDRLPGASLNIAGQVDEQLGHEFGFYDRESLIIESHESDGNSDSWKALHHFGPV